MPVEKYGKEENSKENKMGKKSTTPTLDYYGKNLVELAKAGKLDPVFGREKEINKMIQILSKKKKNNPLLIGESGVGKTALAEGLAIKIASGDVDRRLVNKKIIELSMSSLVSGTKYRGEFEQKIEDIIREVAQDEDIIIFLDEIHTIVGAGDASGSLDAANIIKPAISRGEMKCIGTTTSDEFKKIIENDSALERRFQKVFVDAPTKEETYAILENIKIKYENYHNVIYSEEVLHKCIDLTDRYITNRNFPDKAIDVIDEVGSWAKLLYAEVPKKIKELEENVKVMAKNKKKASDNQEFEEAAKLRDEELLLRENIKKENKKWEDKQKKKKIKITVGDVANIVSSHTDIPVEKIKGSQIEKLKKMGEYMSNRVIGQCEAVEKVVQAIQRSKVGIQDPAKPLASFLFLGSTGVGKTQLAKVLAEYLFDTQKSLIRIDMSEYMESSSVAKLIGAPPGYVGHEEKGQLTEDVKTRPYSIILFDEIEKAHPQVSNVLLQILDEGMLTDSTGSVVNFKNTIIIMTSNIGTRALNDRKNLGFGTFNKKDEIADIKNIVLKQLEKEFKPELVNRIDEKIVFNTLIEDDILKIVDIEINHLMMRVLKSGYNIKVSDALKKYIAEVGYDKKYGARPVKRMITSKVETFITSEIINENIKMGENIILTYNTKEEKIELTKIKKNK